MDDSSSTADAPPTWYIGHHESNRLFPATDQLLHLAQEVNYDMITTPITTTYFHTNVEALLASHLSSAEVPIPLVPALTPSDSTLTPRDNISQLLASTSTHIDLASPDPVVANISRQVFNLEIAYAAFCGIQNIIVPGPILFDGTVCTSRMTQYARAIQEALVIGPYLQLYILLPMAGSDSKASDNSSHYSRFARSRDACDVIENASAWATWEAWNVIRTLCCYSGRLVVALQFPRNLPSPSVCSRWYSEPVRILCIPESCFILDSYRRPTLHKGHKHLLSRFMRLRTMPWILLCDVGPIPLATQMDGTSGSVSSPPTPKGSVDLWPLPSDVFRSGQIARDDPTPYLSYIRHLQNHQPPRDALDRFVGGYQDYLQTPLQPLADHLESITYEVFEKDPVKYEWYERAIVRALTEWSAESKPTSSASGAVVIAVAGSGRGPLVTRALRASQATSVPIEIWAIEKNPNAFVVLQRHNETDWNGQVTVVKTDMRSWEGPKLPDGSIGQVDILISELLGSFADNELSPECLDGVQHVLNPVHGISIPSSYTAHITPISTPKLYADILGKSGADSSVFELPYVVMLSAFDYLSTISAGNCETGNNVGMQHTPSAQEPWSIGIPNVQTCWSFQHPAPPTVLLQSKLRRGGSAVGGWGGVNGGDGANEHNARFALHNFHCKEKGTCHGLAGYFEAVLYEGFGGAKVELSTNPVTMDAKSKDMISWFPIFFPLKVPIAFPDNSELQVSIWRQTDDRKVWYEWMIEAFIDMNGVRSRLSTTDLHSSKKVGCLM